MAWSNGTVEEQGVQCSLCKVPTVYLEQIVKQKVELLAEEYPHQEWFCYLVGRVSKKQNVFVEDISVPPHAHASGAAAEAEPFNQPKDTVGVLHSHNSMGAFHSGTDHDYVDKNYPVSITVAKRGNGLEFDSVAYITTPCGKNSLQKCTVNYVAPKPLFDTKVWLAEAKANIDKGRVEVHYGTGYQGSQALTVNDRPYVPMKYRLDQNTGSLVSTDGSGIVLTEAELQATIAELYN